MKIIKLQREKEKRQLKKVGKLPKFNGWKIAELQKKKNRLSDMT